MGDVLDGGTFDGVKIARDLVDVFLREVNENPLVVLHSFLLRTQYELRLGSRLSHPTQISDRACSMLTTTSVLSCDAQGKCPRISNSTRPWFVVVPPVHISTYLVTGISICCPLVRQLRDTNIIKLTGG